MADVYVVRITDTRDIVEVCDTMETALSVMTCYLTEKKWDEMQNLYTALYDNFPTFCKWVMQKLTEDDKIFNGLYKNREDVPTVDTIYEDVTRGKFRDKVYNTFSDEVLDYGAVIDWIYAELKEDVYRFDYYVNVQKFVVVTIKD